MDGGAKVPFVRHSVQCQRQSLLNQRRRTAVRPCKNRRSPTVPDQYRHGPARGGWQGLQHRPVGVGQGGHAAPSRNDGPVRRIDGDGPTAVPDGLDAGNQRQRWTRSADELPGFAGHEDLISARLDPGTAKGGGEVLARKQAGADGGEAVSPRKPVAATDADEGGGEGGAFDTSVHMKRPLSHWERA